jgi:hypothetical protein
MADSWFKERHDIPIVNKRFKSVARLAIWRMEELSLSSRNKAAYKTYIQTINNYLIPLLGNHNVDKIDNAVLAKCERERLEVKCPVPVLSTITTLH